MADVVRDELTILRKKLEENPDILSTETFLATVDRTRSAGSQLSSPDISKDSGNLFAATGDGGRVDGRRSSTLRRYSGLTIRRYLISRDKLERFRFPVGRRLRRQQR